MSANSVDSAQYVDGSIDLAHMSANSVDSDQYVDGSVDFAHIQNVVANGLLVRNASDAGVLSEFVLASAQLMIGDGSGMTAAALSGDATMTNAGVVTITGASGDFAVSGDLSVTGEYIEVAISTLEVDDLTITLAKNASSSATADGAGIVVDGASATLLYDHTGTQWEFNKPLEVQGHLLPQATATYDLGSTGLGWNDLHLDSGGVINFDNSDVTITHSSNTITVAGGTIVTAALTATTITTSGNIELGHASDTTIARSGSGDITIEGNAVYRAGGTDVPVTDGGTGASSLTDGGVLLGSGTGAITAMAVLSDGEMIVGDGSTDPVAESGATLRTSIGVGTGDSPQFTAIELGHASDTTIARSGSGAITVEGTAVLLAGAQTGITTDYNTGRKVGRDADNLIDFATTDNKLIFRVEGVNEVELVQNALEPVTDDGVALGTTSLGWSDLHLATGGVINWADGEMTITEGDANTLTVAGGTFATAALTTSTIVASGIIKTDDATEATSTTDGSLQTDGGLSVVKSAVIGDDLDLLSNGAILNIGSAQKFIATHANANNTLTVTANHRLAFGDAGDYIAGDGTDISIVGSNEINLDAATVDINASTAVTVDTPSVTITDTTTSSATEGGFLRLASNDGAVMASGHRLGVIEFAGAEDTSNTITVGARIEALCDATWSASENGADLVFYTTDGNNAQSEVLRLDSNKLATFAAGITATGNILPAAAGTPNIGSTSAEFGHVYLADAKNVHFGSDQDFTLGFNTDYSAPVLDTKASTLWVISSGETTEKPEIYFSNAANDTSAGHFTFYKSRGWGGSANRIVADDDYLGTINWSGDDGDNSSTSYAKIFAQSSDITAGDQCGKITFQVVDDTSLHSILTLGGRDIANSTECEVTVNDGSVDCNFRVESNGNTHMLFVDGGNNGVGIGIDTARGGLTVVNDYQSTAFESLLSDGQFNGDVLRYSPGADDTLTAGALYFLHTDGTWNATDASAVATGGSQLLGVGLGGSSRTVGALTRGFIRIPSGQVETLPGSGACDGLPVYVSETAGKITFTAPSANASIVRIVGYAIDDDSSDVLVFFDPDKSWVEVSA
jgi:phage gp45-like